MDSPAAKRVSKACDACKLRKVKCNGRDRCQQCSHLGLRCVYSVTSKTRAQGKRGRIISEYKNKTANASIVSTPILPAGTVFVGELPSPHAIVPYPVDQGAATSPDAIDPKIQYGRQFFLDLIPNYIEGVYPVQPVITESELRDYIHLMDHDLEIQSFIFAFGACTLNLTRTGDDRTEEVTQTIEHLMNYSIQTLPPPYRAFRSSVVRAMQSMFIHNCLMSMSASDAAFHYLRDSISAIQLLRIDSAEGLAGLPPHERSRRQRLYWQAFIHERFVAILDYRNAILPPLDTLPEDDPTIPIQIHEGFNQIIKLFSLLDQSFLKNWVGSQDNKISSQWIEAKSRELEGDEESNARELAKLTTMQRADLAITREWLRTLVWRLAMSQTLLSSRSSKECLSLLFPVRLSQNLRQQVTSMSRADIEIHGSSITQKLFEITDTIADVLIHVPASTLEELAQRIEDYLFVLDFVLQFPTLDLTRRSILLEKLERLQSMFPEVCSTASSPTMPFEMQSPSRDPWLKVAHSKIGGDGGGGEAGLEQGQGMGVPFIEPIPQAPVDQRQAASTWNDISRRLSRATFAVT